MGVKVSRYVQIMLHILIIVLVFNTPFFMCDIELEAFVQGLFFNTLRTGLIADIVTLSSPLRESVKSFRGLNTVTPTHLDLPKLGINACSYGLHLILIELLLSALRYDLP